MKTIQVYDKPMCCSTGVCGPDVDPILPQFAADLQWLKSQGHQVERFNLAQQPEAFIQHPAVHQLLATQGTNCLPVIVVNGAVVSRQCYPTRDQLIDWTASHQTAATGCCGGPAKDSSQGCCVADEQAASAVGVGCGCQATGCC